MRIDLIETGNQDIDIEFNGKRLDGVVWADDTTGECEVFEQHWFTQERIPDENGPMGYQSMKLKGTVKINDRRPKTQPSLPMDPSDWFACGMCIIQVFPLRFGGGQNGRLVVTDVAGKRLGGWDVQSSDWRTEVQTALDAWPTVTHIEVDSTGPGASILQRLQGCFSVPVYPN